MIFEFESKLFKQDSAVWHYSISVPNDIKMHFGSKRVICTINNEYKFQTAILSSKENGYFININKEIRTKLGIDINDVFNIKLQEDKSKYGISIPSEFEELLKQDEEGSLFFHNLTKGKQRSLLYIINKPKNSDLKLKKGLIVLDYLKYTGGILNFKELNLALKNSNR